jgi:protein gp37
MGEETGISWTEATWNPWMGCTKISPGCDACYMFRDMARYGRDPQTVARSKTKFDAPLKMDGSRLIFTCSWSDWFHPDADRWRDEAWDVVRRTPQHTYQILTKRPGLISTRLPWDWGDGWPNVWLGVSIESLDFAWRADKLREVPAALRFISAEPLLGSLFNDRGPSLTSGVAPSDCGTDGREEGSTLERARRAPLDLTGFDWVIAGGESGSRADARPMHPQWAREIRDALIDSGYRDGPGTYSPYNRPAFHFKQWGAYVPCEGAEGTDVCLSEDGTLYVQNLDYVCAPNESDGVWMRYAGLAPKSGGKLLDGVEWCEIPDRLTLA